MGYLHETAAERNLGDEKTGSVRSLSPFAKFRWGDRPSAMPVTGEPFRRLSSFFA